MGKDEANPFINWLNQELVLRGWSYNRLAQQAGISMSVLSKARNGRLPKWRACEAIAAALQMPPELVFRKAGLLAANPSDEAGFEDWVYILSQLSPLERQELLALARARLEIQEREARASRPPKPPRTPSKG